MERSKRDSSAIDKSVIKRMGTITDEDVKVLLAQRISRLLENDKKISSSYNHGFLKQKILEEDDNLAF